VSVIGSILASPSEWTGERIVSELPLHMHDDPHRGDPSLPNWLRVVIDVCEFDTHVQMEGLLGWWEYRAVEDLGRMIDAFKSTGLPDQVTLLTRASEVLHPGTLEAGRSGDEYAVSSFGERHPWLDDERYREFAECEAGLYLNAGDGPDLYAALIAYADAGLNGRE
jgi:hypothetical protein